MGDVLKDCCEAIGVTECLGKAYTIIQHWGQTYGSNASGTTVPHWQELEAPLFSLRAMGRMVSPEERTVLPQVIPLLTTVPDHEKLKFQAIMALGRYTEWTAQHPDTLEPQLNYVISGFQHPSTRSCTGSRSRLSASSVWTVQSYLVITSLNYTTSTKAFSTELKPSSQEEITQGVAAVVAVQPPDKTYASMKLFCDPVMSKIVSMAEQAKDESAEKIVADYLGLITIFIQFVQPYVGPNVDNPAVRYCKEILPALSEIAKHFTHSIPILERVCRCWRYMIISYRTAMAPLLPELATAIAEGFQASRQGSFLWATDAVIREFSHGAEDVDESTSNSVYSFFSQQATTFFRILTELQPVELPDMVEDFFRLAADAVRYYPDKVIPSSLAEPMVNASLTALSLQQLEPLLAALHFLRDFLDFGYEHPPVSNLDGPNGSLAEDAASDPECCEAHHLDHWSTDGPEGFDGTNVLLSRGCVPRCLSNHVGPFQHRAAGYSTVGPGHTAAPPSRNIETCRSQQAYEGHQ